MQDLTPNNEATGNFARKSEPLPFDGRVFISYAREDEAFVLRLAGALKARGVPVWLDQWCIPPGADWDQNIDRALRESSKVIVVLSPAAVASPQVRAEIQAAVRAAEKAVFPVLFKNCEVPRILRLYQFSDFREFGKFDPVLARLAEALGHAKPSESPPPPTSWRNFVTKFGQLMQRRLMLAAIISATVIAFVVAALAVKFVVDPSLRPPPVNNLEKPGGEIRPPEQSGNLQVSVNVDEARVSLDGTEVGVARHSVPLILRGVPAGEHRLRIEATGYVPEERRITISPDDWASEGVALRQSAPVGR